MFARLFYVALLGVALAFGALAPAQAAPYAAMVMDARNGEVLHSRNADTRLHPASLTKMMTLYIAFEAIRLGEITLDTEVTISREAAATEYAMGFQAGSRVRLRYLIRAAAVRSSNDGAAAIVTRPHRHQCRTSKSGRRSGVDAVVRSVNEGSLVRT